MKVIKKEPKNIKALFRRGKAYGMINDLDKALEDLSKALDLDPNNQEIKRELNARKVDLETAKKKEKQFYGGLFKKLSEESKGSDSSLYQDKKFEEEQKTKRCTICNQEVDAIQWARHVIKYHGTK